MKPTPSVLLTFLITAALASAPGSAKAAAALTFLSGQPANVEQANTYAAGNEFTVGSSSIIITSAAAFVGNLDNNNSPAAPNQYVNNYSDGGFTSSGTPSSGPDAGTLITPSFTVNFYDLGASTPVLLESVVVPTGTAVVGATGLAYVNLPTPLTIAAGTVLGVTDFIGLSGVTGSGSTPSPFAIDYSHYGSSTNDITTIGTGLTYDGVIGTANPTTYDSDTIPTFLGGQQVVTSDFTYNVVAAPEPSASALLALGFGLLVVLGRRSVRRMA